MRRSPRQDKPPSVTGDLQLGLVIVPEMGRLEDALESLRACALVKLGPTSGHRIPATAVAAVGEDEALLEQLVSLDGVMHVDVAFAQVVEDET